MRTKDAKNWILLSECENLYFILFKLSGSLVSIFIKIKVLNIKTIEIVKAIKEAEDELLFVQVLTEQ